MPHHMEALNSLVAEHQPVILRKLGFVTESLLDNLQESVGDHLDAPVERTR